MVLVFLNGATGVLGGESAVYLICEHVMTLFLEVFSHPFFDPGRPDMQKPNPIVGKHVPAELRQRHRPSSPE